MEMSNINDLCELIKEKEKVYTFRKLEKKDAQDILALMTHSFLSDNEGFKILQVTEQDLNTDQSLQLFSWMIQEELSFGAFHEDQLVSACLSYDLSSNNDLHLDGPEPSKVMMEINDMINQLLDQYGDTSNLGKKELAYLSHLATKSDHFQQHLALSCAYLSVQECRKQGFKQLITGAGHIGTQKTFSKIFKKFDKIKEINEVKGQPAYIVSLIGSLQ